MPSPLILGAYIRQHNVVLSLLFLGAERAVLRSSNSSDIVPERDVPPPVTMLQDTAEPASKDVIKAIMDFKVAIPGNTYIVPVLCSLLSFIVAADTNEQFNLRSFCRSTALRRPRVSISKRTRFPCPPPACAPSGNRAVLRWRGRCQPLPVQ